MPPGLAAALTCRVVRVLFWFWSRLLEFNFHKNELVWVWIHDVVLDAGVTRIGLAGREISHDLAIECFLHQLAGCQHYHDVVMRVPVPTCLRAGREAPFRDN